MIKQVHVAAAVIEDAAGHIFLAKRPDDKHQGGLWEFPGGKVEAGETAIDALKRELHEEIGIDVELCEPFIQIPYHYPDKSILLDVFHVTSFRGDAWGKEGQEVQWVAKAQLERYPFPAANKPIVNALLLPNQLLITPDCSSLEQCVSHLEKSIKTHEVNWVMLRQTGLDKASLAEWYHHISQLRPFTRPNNPVWLTLNTDIELANRLHLRSLHLNSKQLMSLQSREAFHGRWLGASCHNEEELVHAQTLGCDYVTLSPVKRTSSHPEAAPLGWSRTASLVKETALPIILLGGLTGEDLVHAKQAGAQGIAAISAWWE